MRERRSGGMGGRSRAAGVVVGLDLDSAEQEGQAAGHQQRKDREGIRSDPARGGPLAVDQAGLGLGLGPLNSQGRDPYLSLHIRTTDHPPRAIPGTTNSSLPLGMNVPASGPIIDGANGILLPLTLNGDSAGEAVYTVPLVIGHRGASPWTGGRPSSVDSTSSTSTRSDVVGTYTGTSLFPGPASSTTPAGGVSSASFPMGNASVSVMPASTAGDGTSATSIGSVSSDASVTLATTPAQPVRRQRERSWRAEGAAHGMARRAEVSASDYQTMEVQVDLGSSDLWVVGSTCTGNSCSGSGFSKFNAGRSMDTGVYSNMTYQTGFASGEVYWDEVQIGNTADDIVATINGDPGVANLTGFDIAYQAMIVADTVENEDLSGGQFDGVMGMALPANSVISSQIPGSTTGNPDGATFLDNLFSSGTGAPQGRFFALGLGRAGDSRTKSSLGIAKHDTDICADPCTPNYLSLVSTSSGPTYWRVILQGITATSWQSPGSSSSPPANPKSVTISLPSSSVTTQSWPVAVFDSGGSQILFGNRNLLNAVYGAYNIGPSPDGKYYVPCSLEMSLAFTFNGVQYPVHPLDMSDYSSNDHTTCLGSMQYAAGINAGDVILGSTFLKNVYSVYTYPATGSSTSQWAPQVGLVSITNASQASLDFYAVRVLNQPLASATAGAGGASSTASPGNVAAGRHVVSAGIIAGAIVAGILALAIGAFCGWFFWLRRKHGAGGHVGAAADDNDSNPAGGRRSKKFMSMQRQKSMVDGYSDFDVDSWAEESTKTTIDEEPARRVESADSRVSSQNRQTTWETPYPAISFQDSPRHRDKSPSASTMRTLLYSSPGGGEPLDPYTFQTPSPSRRPLMPRAGSSGSYSILRQGGPDLPPGEAYEMTSPVQASPDNYDSPLPRRQDSVRRSQ